MKFCSFAFVLAVLVAPGCSGGAVGDGNREPVYRTSGKITLEGAPVADATVTFSPKGGGPPATGRTNANGEYKLTTYTAEDGATAGDFVVLVVKTAAPATFDPDAGHDADGTGADDPMHAAQPAEGESESELPRKYSRADETTLEATVSAGGPNNFDFDLTP
jgi:hypothetical protein